MRKCKCGADIPDYKVECFDCAMSRLTTKHMGGLAMQDFKDMDSAIAEIEELTKVAKCNLCEIIWSQHNNLSVTGRCYVPSCSGCECNWNE